MKGTKMASTIEKLGFIAGTNMEISGLRDSVTGNVDLTFNNAGFLGGFESKASLISSQPTPLDGSTAIVEIDETHGGARYFYVYREGAWGNGVALDNTASFNVAVNGDEVPDITTTDAELAGVEGSYSRTLMVIPTGDYIYSAEGLPAWASFDTETGTISGSAATNGTTEITVSAELNSVKAVKVLELVIGG